MAAIHKIIVFVGFLSLFHSAFSAAQHRTYLRITSQEFTSLPLDIVIQAVLSLFTVMWGILNMVGKFREINSVAELNKLRWESEKNVHIFYIFSHRGKALSPNYVPVAGKWDLDHLE